MKTSFSRELDIEKQDLVVAILFIIKDNGPKEKGMEKDCIMKSEMVKKSILCLVFMPITDVVNKAID